MNRGAQDISVEGEGGRGAASPLICNELAPFALCNGHRRHRIPHIRRSHFELRNFGRFHHRYIRFKRAISLALELVQLARNSCIDARRVR